MKRLLQLCALFITGVFTNTCLEAQTVTQNGNDFIITPPPDRPKGVQTWFEYGDGGFSSSINSNRVLGAKIYEPLLVTVPLYDTSKDRAITLINTASNISSTGSGRNNTTLHNEIPVLPSGKSLYITRNTCEIVPHDPMIFALTYKKPVDIDGPVNKRDQKKIGEDANKYYILFFYNDTRSLQPITEQKELADAPVNNIRNFEQETIDFTTLASLENIEPKVKDYTNCIRFTLDHLPESGERNIFINADAETKLDLYKSCSVYAIFVSQDPATNILKKIDDFLIEKIPFALAHDPNYLAQTPYCIRLPKKIKTFEYKLHFQNIGEGDADQVRALVTLPDGMDITTFRILSSNFAGRNGSSFLRHTILQNGKQIEFFFTPSSGILLQGTYVNNAGTNPVTMGEVDFSIDATVNVKDSLQSEAAIYFRNSADQTWNEAVLTNKPVSYYKECCDCSICECKPSPVPSRCYKILGLCWWWWLLILAALFLTWWFVAARRRRKKRADNT